MNEILEKIAKTIKRRGHPYSEAQRRWAWAEANRGGDISKRKAHEWSKRVEGKDLPEHTNYSEKKAALMNEITQKSFINELQKIASN